MKERTKQIGLNTFLRIVKAWGLQESEGVKLLGLDHIPRVSEVSVDHLERISHTLGIYKALHTLLPETADAWILKPNDAPVFGGRPALDILKAGTQGFREVRAYLVRQVEGIE